MAHWHGYFGVEKLILGATKWQTLLDALDKLGPGSSYQPAKLLHCRDRLDGDARICEALFNKSALTINKFKERLALLYGVDPDDIDHDVMQPPPSFGGGVTQVITFTYLGQGRLRVALFGGVGALWNESGDECRGYLALHSDEWEPEEEL